MPDGLERLRDAWGQATVEERVAFLKEIYGPGGGTQEIDIHAGVGVETLEPFVMLTWEDRAFHLSPERAREHALNILECAEGAVHDAFLVRWVLEHVGSDRPRAFALLQDLRAWRQRRAERPEDPEGVTG